MITKEQREKDRAICESVTKPLPWTYSTSNSHRWFLSDGRGAVAYGTKLRDGADDIVIDDRDGKHLENAANRLPAYIAAAEEMERRIETLGALARALEAGEVAVDGVEHVPEAMRYAVTAGTIGGLQMAIAILRGAQ